MTTTIFDVIAAGAPAATAIGAPGANPQTYAGLKVLAERTVNALNERGIGRNDRVAIVLRARPPRQAACHTDFHYQILQEGRAAHLEGRRDR